MSVGQKVAGVREWVFRSAAARAARARLETPGGPQDRAHRQARLLVEVARRAREPFDALPPGERPAVELTLYRDAVYWALASQHPAAAGEAPTLARLWEGYPQDRLRAYAGDDERLAAVTRSLLGEASPVSLDTRRQQVDRVRAFLEAFLEDLEGPRRHLGRVVAQRWIRIGALALVLVGVGVGVRKLVLGPNLLEGRTFRTSTTFAGCGSPCEDLLFHTETQDSPWVQFDLGAPKPVRRLEVANRRDCCGDRAVPLVAEVSLDAVKWTEVGRRTEDFATWKLRFPRQSARYVRLRVLKNTAMHLREVVVR